MSLFTYLFWPNPANAYYSDSSMLLLLGIGLACVLLSIALRVWRQSQKDGLRRKLSASWPSAALWFGIVLLILVVARVESIQFVAMRLWVFVWGLSVLAYLFFQVRRYKTRYYEILPRAKTDDPRAKYLPKKKR